jgi:drug/metabolite transporter (DMT)-like permease
MINIFTARRVIELQHQGQFKQLYGILLVILSAFLIGLVPTSTKLVLDAGGNTLTTVTLRGIIAVSLLIVALPLSGQSFRVEKRAMFFSILAGLCYVFVFYGYLGSVAYIPVSSAVLIFFTHPLLLALIAHIRGVEKLGLRKLCLACVALVGLALALEPDTNHLSAIGVALAALASATVCGVILFGAEAQKTSSSTQVMFYSSITTTLILGIITFAFDAWSFPTTMTGWASAFMVGFGAVTGWLAFFASFRLISPVRATMISAVEPPLSVLMAVLVLGEQINGIQWGGIAIVIVSLLLFELASEKS